MKLSEKTPSFGYNFVTTTKKRRKVKIQKINFRGVKIEISKKFTAVTRGFVI
jgi:hypothetical protein